MGDAPETVWVGRDERYEGGPFRMVGRSWPDATEYVRADLCTPDRDGWKAAMEAAENQRIPTLPEEGRNGYALAKAEIAAALRGMKEG